MSTDLTQQKAQGREIRVVQDDGPLSFMMDTARFEHMQRFAQMLGRSTLTPRHLKGETQEETLGNCFRVINQALRWEVDPFALADESYVVAGKLGYQGKLVAAIVMKHARLEGRLRQEYTGSGQDRTIKIIGRFRGEDVDREISLSVRQAATKNEMWTKDPDQKLWYSGVTKWARRHCPEVLLGVLTDDDLERIVESTPREPISLQSLIAPRIAEQPAVLEPVQQEPKQLLTTQDYLDRINGALNASVIDKLLKEIQADHAESPFADGDLERLKAACDQKKNSLK